MNILTKEIAQELIETSTEITIPHGYDIIDEGAFAFSNIKSVVIPNSVAAIADAAFTCCADLKSVTIPESVTVICDNAFSGCESLTEIILPTGVTKIGEHAFFNCFNLASITMPESVKKIGKWAFDGCKNLTVYSPRNSYVHKHCTSIFRKIRWKES